MKQQKQPHPYLIPVLCGTLAIALGVMLFALLKTPDAETAAFVPPPFEENAVSGTPEVPEELGYSSPYREGMGYRFSVCGDVTTEGENAIVYFTNPAGNETWLKLRILDGSGNLLGETGLLKPGEYVRSVHLNAPLADGAAVCLKIMGYEPDTYHSAGAVTLRTTARHTGS